MQVDLDQLKKSLEEEVQELDQRKKVLMDQMKQVDAVARIAQRVQTGDDEESASDSEPKPNGCAAPEQGDGYEWAFQGEEAEAH